MARKLGIGIKQSDSGESEKESPYYILESDKLRGVGPMTSYIYLPWMMGRDSWFSSYSNEGKVYESKHNLQMNFLSALCDVL